MEVYIFSIIFRFSSVLDVFEADRMNIEWLIVKGVAGYGDFNESSTDDWKSFASVMAASFVAHILCDSGFFKDRERPLFNAGECVSLKTVA